MTTIMPKKIKKLLKKRWYYQGFNGTPALLSYPSMANIKEAEEILGYSYHNEIEFYEGDKCYYLYDWADLERNLKIIINKVKADPHYLNWMLKKDEELRDQLEQEIKRMYTINIPELTFEEAVEEFKTFGQAIRWGIAISLIIECFTYPTEDLIRNSIKDELEQHGRDGLVEEGIKLLIAAVQPSFVGHHQIELLKIAKKKKEGKDVTKDIEELQKKKFWMNNAYAGSKILPVSHFAKELADICKKFPNPKKELKERKQHFDTIIKRKHDFMKKHKLSEELQRLIEINNTMGILHDTRKGYITEANHFTDLFMKRFGKELNIPLSLMRYVPAYEIYDKKRRSRITKELLEERKKQCFLTYIKDEVPQIWSGETAKAIIKELTKEHDQEEHDTLHGHCASQGKTIGIVRVCRGLDTIHHFKKGEILVACMTQPEFVPAMRKAAAIVTDEGGLTCHAAIISRELGKPCLISTKKATRILKDGMKVEVNATEGYVKILNK